MRLSKSISVGIWICLFSILGVGTSFAQNGSIEASRPHTLLVLVRSSAIPRIRAAFDSIRKLQIAGRVNLQTLAWQDGASIGKTLGLPHTLTPISLKPFIAQHNAAIEDVRERMEPNIFATQAAAGVSVSDPANALSATETRVARWFVLTYAENIDPEQARTLLRKSAEVELAEPKYIPAHCFTPNDPLFVQMYGPQVIHAPEAWDVSRCDSTIVVADVDVGTDWSHEDLQNAIFINKGEVGLDSNGLDKRSNGVDDDGNGFVDDWHGWDFGGVDGTVPDNDARTQLGHGTHTAGTIAASGNNGVGVIGIAFGARLIPLKGGSDQGSLDFVYEAIVYAADMGARVVNCSWGGPTRAQAEQDVINFVTAKGLGVMAAAGNNGRYQEFYPASYHNVLSVGAVDYTGGFDAGYSNHSTRLAVCAPGTNVISTYPGNNYGLSTGTSMASPHATGSVAMVVKRFPQFKIRQAMEQVRATCDTLPINLFPGLTGRGRINLFRAVSDVNAHSARIDSVQIVDASNDGILSPGESGSIVLHVTNYLSPLTQLQAKIEILSDPTIVTTSITDLRFGSVGTLHSITNRAVDFPIAVSATAPQATVLVKVTFSDIESGYTNDVDYFTFVINPSYRDLYKNNLTVTVDQRGAIGYGDEPNNALGSGFFWRDAPSSILASGRSVVYAAGLMIGEDSARVVSDAPGPFTSPVPLNDTDFTAIAPLREQAPIEKTGAVQEIVARYDDAQADPPVQVGVSISQKAYAFVTGLSANAMVLDYAVNKKQRSDGQFPTDDVSIAFYADWDIGISGANNTAGFDSVDQIAWVNRLDANYPYVGVALLSVPPAGSALNVYLQDNDGSNGSVNAYDGLLRQEKWTMMTTPRLKAGAGDVAMTYGLKHVPLFTADAVPFTLVLALATDELSLHKTVEDTRNAWLGRAAVERASEVSGQVTLYPNPFTSSIHVGLKDLNATTVVLYDVLGRIVLQEELHGRNSLNIPTAQLAAGDYSLVVSAGSTKIVRNIVHVK
jgi:serine protease